MVSSIFILNQFFECKQEELNYYEAKFIQEYNSFVPNGYNATYGGDGRIIYDYNKLVEDYYRLNENISAVCRENNCDYTVVRNALKDNHVEPHTGYDFLQTPIYECDINKNILHEFKNVQELQSFYPNLPIYSKNIANYLSDVIAERQKSYYGHYFCYKENYEDFKKKDLHDCRYKKVKCVENQMIFNSTSDAARWIVEQGISKGKISGINSNIGRAIKRDIKAYGYKWKRIED